MKKPTTYWIKAAVSLVLLGLFAVYFVSQVREFYWVLPVPSDQLEYIQTLIWNTTVGGYFPWLDRITLGVSLALIELVPRPLAAASSWYALFACLATFAMAVGHLWRRVDVAAGIVLAIYLASSYLPYFFASQIYPEPTVVVWCLAALLSFLAFKKTPTVGWAALTGLIACAAGLTKITACFVPVYFLVRVAAFGRDRKQVLAYVGGALAALPLLAGAFAMIYGPASLVDMVTSFIQENFVYMYKGRAESNNVVAYVDLLFNRNFLPIFLPLVAGPSLWKDPVAREHAALAWLFMVFLCGIHVISGRGGPIIWNYIYPSTIFATVAVAAHYGRTFERGPFAAKIFGGVLALGLMKLGFELGRPFHTPALFVEGMSPMGPFTKLVLGGGFLLLILSVVAFEVRRSRILALVTVLTVALWGSAYSGGILVKLFRDTLHPEWQYYYERAPALERVPSAEFAMYVERWVVKDFSYHRIPVLFRVFYCKQHCNYSGPEALDHALDQVKTQIKSLRDFDDLASTKFEWLLTDSPEKARSAFPDLEIRDRFVWQDYELYVMHHPR